MNELDKLKQRYLSAMHGVQTGVSLLIEHGDAKEIEPKHLRVGVDSALVDSGALGTLLIKKGVISEIEYAEALCFGAEREVENYRWIIKDRLGMDVKLR